MISCSEFNPIICNEIPFILIIMHIKVWAFGPMLLSIKDKSHRNSSQLTIDVPKVIEYEKDRLSCCFTMPSRTERSLPRYTLALVEVMPDSRRGQSSRGRYTQTERRYAHCAFPLLNSHETLVSNLVPLLTLCKGKWHYECFPEKE